MKRMKKIAAMLAALAMCVLLPGANTLTASAAANTYCVKYVTDQWRYQEGSTWNDAAGHRELYYLYEGIKDGDTVVIDGAGNTTLNLALSVRLSNLTLNATNNVVVSANGIDNCYILGNTSVTAVTSDITNAYVYDNASVTLNKNVNTLTIQGTSDIVANVTCAGTVAHLIGKDNLQTYYDVYNVAEGKLLIENGSIRMEDKYFTRTAPVGTTQTTSTATTTTQQTTTASSSEYDDVPKTGESNLIFWLIGIAAACFAGKYMLKKA